VRHLDRAGELAGTSDGRRVLRAQALERQGDLASALAELDGLGGTRDAAVLAARARLARALGRGDASLAEQRAREIVLEQKTARARLRVAAEQHEEGPRATRALDHALVEARDLLAEAEVRESVLALARRADDLEAKVRAVARVLEQGPGCLDEAEGLLFASWSPRAPRPGESEAGPLAPSLFALEDALREGRLPARPLADVDQALRAAPGAPLAFAAAAIVRARLGRGDDARRLVRYAREAEGDSLLLVYLEAEALAAAGERESARATLDRCDRLTGVASRVQRSPALRALVGR
jgi:hypothetical protein